ncbi:MAG: Ig-like domain-containing protein [Bacteroidota bacterium]
MMKTALVILLTATFAAQGCKEQDPILVPGLGSLYDPSIRPAVIFTYPANNTVGPYTGLYNGEGMYGYPHFKIQFNKLMKDGMLNEENVKITGFDEPVMVTNYSYNDQTGIYNFMVQYVNGGSYYSMPIFRIGRTYTVTVSSLVQDIHNQYLSKDYQFSFSMGNSFNVISALPKDSLSSSYHEVRLKFNSQVDTNIISKLSITPAVSGNWYLENNGMMVVFYNNANYAENTVYTVTLAATAADKYGNSLGTAYNYSFKSGIFRLTSVSPSEGQSGFPLENNFWFYFNSTVQNSSVTGGVSITPAVNGIFNYYSNSFSFTPLEPLKEKTTYTISLNTNIKSLSGSSLTKEYAITFTTEGFRLKQFLPYYYDKVSRHSNIELAFNTKCDTSSVPSGLSISPAVAGRFFYSNKNKMVTFKPDAPMQPLTNYTVTLNSALKSAAGNSLDYISSYSFTTGE